MGWGLRLRDLEGCRRGIRVERVGGGDSYGLCRLSMGSDLREAEDFDWTRMNDL